MSGDTTPVASPLARFVGADRGRARFSVTPAPPEPLEFVDGLLAGAATVDITPPPGMPKAGYSSNANTGNGFRSRLRARIVHLRAGHASLALVQLDLLGGSSVLQHLVAQAIREVTDIPLAGLMMGATHTHAGPGQFNGTDFYNQFASNRPGFDPAWADFLVRRIAAGVIEAYQTRRPATLAVGSCDVWGLTRNRSMSPFVNNDTITDKREEPQRKFSAINPQLHLIRVDAADGTAAKGSSPLATAVVFSVHGTGISMQASEYNADLWAYLVDELGHQIELDRGSRGVVGAMEGTHADVAPAIHPGRAGHVEAARLGRSMGRAAADLYRSLDVAMSSEVRLATAFREIDLDASHSIDGVAIADHPAVGAALTAGAHENLTPVLHRLPPFRAGTPKPVGHSGPHGHKWILFGQRLQAIALPRRMFPRVLPIQLFQVNSLGILGMPFEVTVESGRRMAAAAHDGAERLGIDTLAVSSVANEYSGYVATREEYARQFYEGGHTLYGPNTLEFLAAHSRHLLDDLADAADGVSDSEGAPVFADVVEQRRWDLKVRRFLARPEAVAVGRSVVSTPRYVDATGDEDGYWEFVWRDAAPGNLRWHEPMVRIEQTDSPEPHLADAGWVPAVHRGYRVDDQGCDVEVRLHGKDAVGHLYAARWHDPEFRVGRRHRFVVLANGAQTELVSVSFD